MTINKTTTDLSTLKINYLTKEMYEDALENDEINENELYITPDSVSTVNNATLTIQKNGTTVNSFTANASSDVIANITVPTKVSDLTNDSGFITGYTEIDPIFNASAAAGITSSNISSWNGKQDALVSGTNIKTINNQSLLGSGDLNISIPTKTSDLTNDSGFISTETDPTVPSWAKASSKPSYNFSEIDNTPTTLSGYGITNAYTKTEVDGLVSGVLHYKGTKTTTSALPSSDNTTGDVWHVTADGSEWAWDGSTWQELGTAVDLSNYVTTDDSRLSDARTPTAHNQALSTITDADDLKAIEALSGTSGLLKKTAANTWTLDTNTYLTSFTEADPVFSASAAAGITSTDISNWNSKTSNTGTVTSVGISNATNGGLSISGSPITDSGSITIGHSNVLTSAQTTSAVYPIKIDKNGHISEYGSAVTIPTTSGETATLTTTWTSNQQTVTVSGVTTSNYVVVSPAPASYDDYCEAGIYCSAQGTNSLTFKCDTAPSSSLTVNVMIIG